MLKILKYFPGSEEELDSFLASRLFAYHLLKGCFIEKPSQGFIQLLISEKLMEIFPERDEDIQIKEGTDLVIDYLKEPNVLSREKLKCLAEEYTYLFIGPGRIPAPPWESVYLSEKRLIFQEQTEEVRKEYQKYGLFFEKFRQEPADHIGLELDFMHHLNQVVMESLEKDDSEHFNQAQKALVTQKDFLSNHLLKWVPQFSQEILKSAETNFYRGFAKILDGFLKADYAHLSEWLGEP